jgi:hypothetical protein
VLVGQGPARPAEFQLLAKAREPGVPNAVALEITAGGPAEAVEGGDTFPAHGLRPLLEPALLRLLGFHTALVAEEPEESEVGVDLAVHHPGEVDFDVGLAGEALVVAEDAELEAVRDEAPEVAFVAVQELLEEAVGGWSWRRR